MFYLFIYERGYSRGQWAYVDLFAVIIGRYLMRS